jgi:hypothetical protein
VATVEPLCRASVKDGGPREVLAAVVTTHSPNHGVIGGLMPSLLRFLFVLAVLAAIATATVVYLADFVHPRTREMTIRIPPARLNPPTP